jgi:two-component system response regulator (stage 0 sporulation protein A)
VPGENQGAEADIVLLDIIMPKLDGLGVLKRIRQEPCERLPVFVILSCIGRKNNPGGHQSRCHSYYFLKPFDISVLVERIMQLTGVFTIPELALLFSAPREISRWGWRRR